MLMFRSVIMDSLFPSKNVKSPTAPHTLRYHAPRATGERGTPHLIQAEPHMPRAFLQPLTSPTTLASGASAVLFIGVVSWWAWTFHAAPVIPVTHPAPPVPLDVSAGATLFGAQPDSDHHDQVQLLGILAFDPQHAAAIISVGGDPARVVPLKGRLNDSTTLSEIRAHSIVLDHDGIQREISLPAAANPDAFVR